MGAALGRIAPSAIAVACGLFAVNFFVKALRWQRLLRAQGIEMPWRVTFAAFMSGQFYAQVTLGRVGEFFRVEALLARGVSAGAALASSLFDWLLDLFLVLIVGGVLAALVLGDTRVAVASAVVMVAGALGLRALLKALGAERAPLAQQALAALSHRPWLARLARGVRDLARGIDPMVRVAPLSEALVWTSIGWVFYFADAVRAQLRARATRPVRAADGDRVGRGVVGAAARDHLRPRRARTHLHHGARPARIRLKTRPCSRFCTSS